MVKTVGVIRKIGLCAAVGSLALGASVASAEQFGASVTIENSLALTVVQDMEFGTLYAAKANNQAVAGLELDPDGSIGPVTALVVDGASAASDAPKFLDLGGHAPARGSVTTDKNFTLTVPNLPASGLATGSAFDENEGIPLTVNADPNQPAFYLVDFTVGDVVGGSVSAGTGPGEHDITADFGVTEIEFAIGATIFTDGRSGIGTTIGDSYQAQVYSGTFDVEASY